MRKDLQERCDRCGKFVPVGALVWDGYDESKAICADCNDRNRGDSVAEQGWNDNRINEYVERNAERSNQMWTETLRFMRDSYEARMENENKKLRDALEMIAADIDEMNALSMGDTTVSLKEVVRLGKVAHKALAEKEITR